MGNSNTLMFKVGIADIKAELDKHKKEIESWVNSNPIKLKVQLEDSSLEQLAAKLKAMGATFGESNEEIKKMKEELNALRTILDAVMNGTSKKESAATNELRVMTKGAETAVQAMNQLSTVVNETMSRAGSGKMFPVLDRVPAIYSKLMFDIENRMTAIGSIMSKGNLPSWLDNGKGRGYINNVYSDYERLLKTMQKFKEEGFIDFHNIIALKDVFKGLESAYGPILKQAAEYNKQIENNAKAEAKAIEQNLKAEERAGAARVKARENQEKEYDKIWQNGIKAREKAEQSYNNATTRLPGLYDSLRESRDLMTLFGGRGFNTSNLESVFNRVMQIKNALEEIRDNKGKHPVTGQTVSEYMKQNDGLGQIKNLKEMISQYEEVGRIWDKMQSKADMLRMALHETTDPESFRRMQTALSNLENQMGLISRQSVSDTLSQMRSNGKAFLQPIEEANSSLKQHAKLVSETAKQTRKEENETAKAQKRNEQERLRAAKALNTKINNLEARKKVDFDGVDTSKLDAAINKLRIIRNELLNIKGVSGSVETITRNGGLSTVNRQIQSEIKELNREKRNALSATNQLTDSEQRLVNAINSSTGAMKNQSQVLSDLKMLALQYISVWGAQSFLNNIIEVGGQLEQQRLSIGAILGDMAAGQHLFDQIKALALISPFGVMELDKDTKQLAAYGFKQSELFDMTKRLADISAGAGTEVSRLALALGHVRSEGALTGYTLRQFAMNNIPMIGKLSERLTELEGKIVSTAEIRKRVSKKEIGYEDVIAVIKDLTNEGGMFFNMQETMAEAVNAKFKNLRDSMDIMYSEMAEGGIGTGLKRIAESLMYLTRNWEDTMRIMGYATAGFLTYKVAMASANTQLLTFGQRTLTTKMALDAKKIALNLNSASVKKLTADEVKQMVTLKLVTREQLLNAVATKKLTADQARLAAATYGVNYAELQSIARMGTLGLVTSGLSLRMRSLILSIRGVGVALKSMFLNPVGIALMAITAGFEIFMRWKQHNQEIAESIDKMQKKGSEGYNNLSDSVNKYMSLKGKMSESELKTAMDDITDTIKNYAPDANNILKQAQSIDDLSKRYEFLRNQLVLTKKAYADLQQVASAGVIANDKSGLGDEIEDYIDDLKDVQKAEQDFYTHRATIERVLAYMDKDGKFKKARRNDDGSLKTISEQIKLIRGNEGWSKTFSAELYSASLSASQAWNTLTGALSDSEQRMKEDVAPAINDFANRIDNEFASKFGSNWKKSGDHVKAAWMEVVEEIGKVPGMTDAVKNQMLDEIFNKRWHLNIDFTTGEVTEKLTGWRKEVQDWLDENKLGIKIGFTDSQEDFIKKVKTLHDSIQAEMDSKGKVLIGLGFKLNDLPSELPSPLATPWNKATLEGYNEAKNTDNLIEQLKKKFNISWKEKNKKEGSKKNPDTENAKAVREQVRIIKEAADAYQYWRDKVGDKGAWEHVKSEFGDVLKKIGITADNIEDVRKHLNNIPNTKAYKAIKDKKIKTEIDKERAKDNDQYMRRDFEKSTEEFLSRTQIELDNLTRSWEMFNSVRDATGNIELAVQLSGVEYANGKNRNLADAVKEQVQKAFNDAGGSGQLDFNKLLSDKEIESMFQNAENAGGEYEKRIKSLVEAYKKWRDLQRDVLKNDTSVFLKAFENEYDRKQQFDKIITQYEESKQSLDNLLSQWMSGAVGTNGNRLGISQEQYNRAFGNLTAQANWEKFKAENDFKWVFDNIGTTSLETIKKMVKAMREYAKTTEMSEKETKAWHEAMDKLLDQESVLNPLNSIADAVKIYNDAVVNRKNAEEALRISKMSYVERKRNGIDESTVKPLQQAQDDYRQALSDEEKALLRVTKSIKSFSDSIGELGSTLSSLGSSIGGDFGDIMNGVGGMLSDISNGMNSATKLAEAIKTKGLSGTISKVSAAIGIINSIVDFNKKLDSLLPSNESLYQEYADRQRKINKLQEQIADYQVEALKRQIENTNWLYTNGLSELRNQGYEKENLLKEYANSMLRPQEIYKEARSGFSKWGPAIIGAIVAVVGTVLTLGIGSVGSAALGATIAAALGTTATAAVGAALAAGAGAAIGTALRSAADSFVYSSDQTSARQNMRVQTRHKTFFRSEKTQNLEDWVRENYGKELFDSNHYDLIDIELAKQLLEDGPTLVGETRETLERLVEYAEKIREIEDNVKEYVSQMFSPLVDDATDALWDWLDNGKDMLDSFEEYASDTFKDIAKDAVKSFLKINLIDKYQDKLNDIFTAYSLGAYNEQELGLAVASVAGDIRDSYEALIPALQALGESFDRAFEAQGYDIINGGSGNSGSTSNTIKGINEQTWDLGISYWNAIRADVSINRAMIAQYFPLFYTSITSGNTKLQNIENNTAAIMRSNDEIRRIVDDVYSLFNGLKTKAWRMPIA